MTGIGGAISSVAELDNSIGCTISRVAGAGLHYWMRRFNCLLIANSAGANSNLPTPIACAAYSAACTVLYFYIPQPLASSGDRQTEAVDMNGRFQMQGGKNWILPKQVNANRFFWDSHWLEISSNHFCPSMGLNGGRVATDSDQLCMLIILR
jgi:hypothetical protein